MNQNLKHFIYGSILLVVGFFLGRTIGIAQTYKDTTDSLTYSYFDCASTNLNSHIKLLKLVQNGDLDKVSNALEKLVNIDLMAISGYETQVPLKDEVLLSIEKAKRYREKHPVSNDPETAKAINKAFGLVK